MGRKFWKREKPMDPQRLLAQAHEQMPAPSRPVTITRDGQELRTAVVTAVEQFRKTVDVAVAGENAGLLLDGVKRADVARGAVPSA